jgi:hypothetical protein
LRLVAILSVKGAVLVALVGVGVAISSFLGASSEEASSASIEADQGLVDVRPAAAEEGEQGGDPDTASVEGTPGAAPETAVPVEEDNAEGADKNKPMVDVVTEGKEPEVGEPRGKAGARSGRGKKPKVRKNKMNTLIPK